MAIYKFLTSEKDAKSFLDGKMLFRNIEHFRQIEADEVGRADDKDGVFIASDVETPFGTPMKLNIVSGNQDAFIMCVSKDLSPSEIVNNSMGDYIVKIDSEEELANRIAIAAKKDLLEYKSGNVQYINESFEESLNTFQRAEELGIDAFSFVKRNQYSFQKEYRFLVNGVNYCDIHQLFFLEIGNISDIARLYMKKDFIQSVAL